MTDAEEQTADIAPGVARLNALSQGGFNTDEVNEYRTRVSGQMAGAGFNDDEINKYWGIKTPNTDKVKDIVNETGDASPGNPQMRSELMNSYERGETRNPSEFTKSATTTLQDVLKTTGSTLAKDEAYLLTSTPASLVSDLVQGTVNLPVQGATRLAGKAYEAAGGELSQPVAEALTQGIPEFGQSPAHTALREVADKALDYQPETAAGKVTESSLKAAPFIAGGEVTAIRKAIGTLASGGGAVAASETAKALGLDERAQEAAAAVGGAPGMIFGATTGGEGATKRGWEEQPKAQDFVDAAAVTNGKDAEAEVSQVLRNIYRETGITPTQVVAEAKINPTVAQDLAAGHIPEVFQPAKPAETPAPEPVAQAGNEAVAPKVGNSAFEMLNPAELKLDPKRFQYKEADEKGVTGALQGTDIWEPTLANPITAWRDKNGNTFVVNGHQRTDLANRAVSAGQEGVQVPARVFNEADGYTPEYMRVLGARQNIAEGSGTAIDAAKIMRGPAIPDSMRLPELPPKSQLVQQANGLAALGDDSFGMVVNGVVPSGYAAEVGRAISDPKEQLAAMDVLAKTQPDNVEQARSIVQDVKNSGFLHGDQTSLFGDEHIAQTVFAERARVLDNSLKQLRKLKSTFNTAVTQEGALTEAGNVLSKEKNVTAKAQNEDLLTAIQNDATRKGPISDALSDAARQLKDGQSIAAVTKQFIARARELNAGEGRGQLQPGAAASGNEPAAERQSPVKREDKSWVIRNKDTGEVIMETFDKKKVDALNTAKYEAIPITEYLSGLNKKIKENGGVEPEQGLFSRQGEATASIPDDAIHVAPGLAGVPTEAYTAKEAEIVKAVNAELTKLLGGKGDVGVFKKLFSTGEAGKPGEVEGYANRRRLSSGEVRYVVNYALSAGDVKETARHEVVHALRKTLTPDEWSTLERAAKDGDWISKHNVESRWDDLNKVQQLEEAIAEEFSRGRADKFKSIPELIRPIFEKMQNFVELVADKARQIFGGTVTAQDVFSRIESGEVGGRPVPGSAEAEAAGKFAFPKDTILGKISIGGNEAPKEKLSWNDFYKAAVDRLDPVRRVVDSMKNGNNATAMENAYKLLRNLAGNYGRAQQFIEGHTFDFDTYKNTGKSLKEILKPVAKDMNGLREYAVSRRALELEARQIKPFGDDPNSAKLMADAKQVIAKGAAKYEPIFKELNTYQASLLKYMKDAGILTDEQVKSMSGANSAYVPFYRVMDDDASVGLTGGQVKNPIKRIRGSERDIIDPIESIVKNTFSYISIAERNAAVKSFFDRASKEANPADYFEKQAPRITPTKVSEAEMDKFLASQGITGVPQDTLTVFRAMRTPLAKDEVGFFDKGKWTVLKVDPDIAEAFNAIPRGAHGALFKMLQVPTKMLRYGIVSPEFILRHLERNTLSATVIGEKGMVPFENLYKGLFSYLNKDAWYEDWLKSGGKVSSLSGLSRDDVVDQVRRLTKEEPATNYLGKAWNVVRSPFEAIHAFQQNLENIQRLGAYKRAINGLNINKESIINSGHYARNVAPDPSRIGSQTRSWNSLTALANAEIQHTAQLVDALRSRPLPTLAKGFALITLPTMLNWALNHNNPAYQESPAWERDAFWIVPAGQYTLRVPKPFLMGFMFGTVPERLLDLVSGNDKHGKGVAEGIKDMFEQALPNVIPNALMPVMEQMTNYSMFRAKPLVPNHLMQELPEYRYSEYTSELTKAAGHLLGKVPYLKDTSMASPMVIDNYLRQWTGALGGYVMTAADASLRKAGVLPDPVLPTKSLADIPFIKAFVSRYPSAQAQSIQDFQNSYNQMKQYQNTFKDLIKQGEMQSAQDLMTNNPTQFYKLDSINKTISEQNKFIRLIYKNPQIGGDEKRQIIDATYYQMISLAKQGNEMLDQLHQDKGATKH